MDRLATRLKDAGVDVSLESVGVAYSYRHTIKMLIAHVAIEFSNILVDLTRLFKSPKGINGNTAGIRVKPAENTPTTASSSATPLDTSKNLGTQSALSSVSPSGGQGYSSSFQLGPVSGSTTVLRSMATSPKLPDYILLCINESRLLITRDDLNLDTGLGTTSTLVDVTPTPVVSDQHLFRCFRAQYFSKRNWFQRLLSLKSLQKITFVKVSISYQNKLSIGKC